MELVGLGVGTQLGPRPGAGNSTRATLSQVRARQRLSAPSGVVGIAAGTGAAAGAVRKVLNYAHKEGKDGSSGPE